MSNLPHGELEHHHSKCWYPCTPKTKDQTLLSMASQEAIERLVEKVIAACAAQQANPRPRCAQMSPSDHYLIAKYAWANHDLTAWLIKQGDDPAIENFIPQLKDHLLAHLHGLAYDGDEHSFSDADCNSVLITDNKLFEHGILCVDYMTYDL
ncbi:hypothetical protein BDR05DRAFT_952566 [Suillus weaverae]|nr:hypothetical protein BDR05DRAFT_952566 [Suillus weaverae]